MEQDSRKLIYMILIFIISYVSVWGISYMFYDQSYQVFPIFNFLSTLAMNFLAVNFLFFIILSYLRFKDKINRKNFTISIIFLLLITLSVLFYFKDFFKYY